LTKPEDVDTDAEDHDFDATKYFLMDHPIALTKKTPPKPAPFGPFSEVPRSYY
jgi:hypothetical protein